MRHIGPDIWAGGAVTALSAVLGVLVMLGEPSESVLVPVWVWSTIFALFFLAQSVGTWWEDHLSATLVRGVFGVQVVAAPALVLLAPGATWLPILLVFTSTLAVYRLRTRWTATMIVVYTACVGLAVALDGGRISAIVLIASIYGVLQAASALSVTAQLRQERLRRDLAVAHAELRAASALSAESSRADERLRISRELHDLLGHQLTALSLELEVASHRTEPPVSEHVDRAKSIARELLTDLRATVSELRRRTPKLAETLERMVADLPEPIVHLQIPSELHVDEYRATALLRCVQEAITNTVRHAGATEMWIDISADERGGVSMDIRDDGSGVAEVQQGNGLRGITERIEEIGGTVTFTLDRGFRIRAAVPGP